MDGPASAPPRRRPPTSCSLVSVAQPPALSRCTYRAATACRICCGQPTARRMLPRPCHEHDKHRRARGHRLRAPPPTWCFVLQPRQSCRICLNWLFLLEPMYCFAGTEINFCFIGCRVLKCSCHFCWNLSLVLLEAFFDFASTNHPTSTRGDFFAGRFLLPWHSNPASWRRRDDAASHPDC